MYLTSTPAKSRANCYRHALDIMTFRRPEDTEVSA